MPDPTRPRMPWIEIAREMYWNARLAVTGSYGRTARELDHMSQSDRFPTRISDYLAEAAQVARDNPLIEGDVFDRAMDNIIYDRVGTDQEVDLVTGEAEGEEEDTHPVSGRTEDNVSVEGTEEETDPNCIIGPYEEIRGTCGENGEAHHIVPDFALRTGNRALARAGDTATRIANAPSLARGMAICLGGGARIVNTEHHSAHAITDAMIRNAGTANTQMPGTATWSDVFIASIAGIAEAKPECVTQATGRVAEQFSNMSPNQLLRARINPNSLSQGTKDALQNGALQ